MAQVWIWWQNDSNGELFAKVCIPGENLETSDTVSYVSMDGASEPSPEPKEEEDEVKAVLK